MFCKHVLLASLLFLIFLFAIFNNSPHSICEKNYCIVSFDVIRFLLGICYKQVFTDFVAILIACSVDVIAAVHQYVNGSIYIFSFYEFILCIRFVYSWAFKIAYDIWKC